MNPARELVLLDIDGTLMRGAGAHHKEALVAGIREVTSIETTFDGVDTAGKLDCDLIATLLVAQGADVDFIRGAIEQIVAACQLAYRTNCTADLSPFVCRGAREALSGLRSRGVQMGLVTGNLSAIGWRKVELAGLRDFFSFGGFSEDGPTRGHLAQIALQRARESGVAAEDCRIALIGDHRNDVEAAKANGIRSVAVASGPMPADELRRCEPDILIETLLELDLETLFR